MKSLKRTMAGEFSRELGGKVRRGMFNLAGLGYKVGGPASYGFRRQLLDANGVPKRILRDGEHKSVTNERVILIPGSGQEALLMFSGHA